MAVECSGSVEVENDADIGRFQSSEWAGRWFCKKCGTALFYKLIEHDYFVVSVDAFDESDAFAFTSEVFIDDKPASYDFANDTKKMTGAEVFAEFQAAQENSTSENEGQADG